VAEQVMPRMTSVSVLHSNSFVERECGNSSEKPAGRRDSFRLSTRCMNHEDDHEPA
jgi:hypothetical protein